MTNKTKLRLHLATLIFIVVIPIVLLILPANFFDDGESICLSKLLANMECPGCGMSRACMHLIHFDFKEGFAYNKMSVIVLPLLAIIWIQWFLQEYKSFKKLSKKTS